MSDQSSLDSLFHLVHALKRQLHSQADKLELGLTPMHIRVIKIIERKKPCTALDITDFLGRDKAQVTRLISTLIDNGLVTKEPNPNDKRSQYLNTTAAGAEIVEKIKGIDAETVDVMTRDINAANLAEFQRIAEIMTRNLQANNEK
jgi:DNA-binding MarR family transcriptional regulator